MLRSRSSSFGMTVSPQSVLRVKPSDTLCRTVRGQRRRPPQTRRNQAKETRRRSASQEIQLGSRTGETRHRDRGRQCHDQIPPRPTGVYPALYVPRDARPAFAADGAGDVVGATVGEGSRGRGGAWAAGVGRVGEEVEGYARGLKDGFLGCTRMLNDTVYATRGLQSASKPSAGHPLHRQPPPASHTPSADTRSLPNYQSTSWRTRTRLTQIPRNSHHRRDPKLPRVAPHEKVRRLE